MNAICQKRIKMNHMYFSSGWNIIKNTAPRQNITFTEDGILIGEQLCFVELTCEVSLMVVALQDIESKACTYYNCKMIQ